MEAALEQLTDRGVLAGLNLREVADTVGVTPANIYHYFGSRQGLLRAAINHEVGRLTAPIDVAVQSSFVEWRARIFDLIGDNPSLRMTALLALDDDPEYEPFALWELAQEHYGRLLAEGELPEGFDVVAAHALSLSMAMGIAIYGTALARQLDIPELELRARTRALFVTMLDALAETGGTSHGDDED